MPIATVVGLVVELADSVAACRAHHYKNLGVEGDRITLLVVPPIRELIAAHAILMTVAEAANADTVACLRQTTRITGILLGGESQPIRYLS